MAVIVTCGVTQSNATIKVIHEENTKSTITAQLEKVALITVNEEGNEKEKNKEKKNETEKAKSSACCAGKSAANTGCSAAQKKSCAASNKTCGEMKKKEEKK